MVIAALWTREYDPAAGAGRPRIIAELRAGPLCDARHVRLHHAFELGRWACLIAALRWLWRLASMRPEPLQCALYATPAAVRAALSGIGEASCVYLDGVRCLAAARHLHRQDCRLICDLDDLMSRRCRLQLAVCEAPNPGHLARQMPRWLSWLLRRCGVLIQRYEAWALHRAERELVGICSDVTLLSPTECSELRVALGAPLAQRVRCMPPAQAIVRPGAIIAAPLRLIFIGGEILAQNRLTLLRLFHLWQTAPRGRELHWFGRREPGGIVPPPGVVCHGFVPDIAATAYDGRSVLLNPAVLAGGVKTKMLEALAHGCPAVGNAAAFEGVSWPDYPLVLPDDDGSWSRFISDPEARLAELQRAVVIGQAQLLREHDPQRLAQRWRELLRLDPPAQRQ